MVGHDPAEPFDLCGEFIAARRQVAAQDVNRSARRRQFRPQRLDLADRPGEIVAVVERLDQRRRFRPTSRASAIGTRTVGIRSSLPRPAALPRDRHHQQRNETQRYVHPG